MHLGIAGRLRPGRGDTLDVVTQNALPTKIDLYLPRSIGYSVHVDPSTGVERATLTVSLTNTAPSSGLPGYVIGGGPGASAPPGTSRSLLSVYSPLSYAGGKLAGRPLLMSSQVELGPQLGELRRAAGRPGQFRRPLAAAGARP